jgi:hypothetical protein
MFADTSGKVLVQTSVYPPILFALGNSGLIRRDVALVSDPERRHFIEWDGLVKALGVAYNSQGSTVKRYPAYEMPGRFTRCKIILDMA